MKLPVIRRRAWAIDLGWKWPPEFPPPLAGVFAVSPFIPPEHMDGLRTALWRTRRAAREYLMGQKQKYADRRDVTYWKRAHVVRVEIVIRIRGRSR